MKSKYYPERTRKVINDKNWRTFIDLASNMDCNGIAYEIKRLAQKAGVSITVKNSQIVIPNDKEQIKLILGFLDEEAYRGPFSQVTYLANSKRKVLNR